MLSIDKKSLLKVNKKSLLMPLLFIFIILTLYLALAYNKKHKEESAIVQTFTVKKLELDSWLAEKKRLVESLTRSLELLEYNKEIHLPFMQKTNKIMGTNSIFSGFKNGLYFDTQGYWISNFDPRTRPWYIETFENKATTVSGPMYYNDISGQKITWWSVSTPFYKDNELFGVVSSEILPKMIREHLKDLFTSQFEDVFLFHKETGIIVSSVQKDKEIKHVKEVYSEELFHKLLQNRTNSLKFMSQDHAKVAYVFNLKEAPWILCGIRKE